MLVIGISGQANKRQVIINYACNIDGTMSMLDVLQAFYDFQIHN